MRHRNLHIRTRIALWVAVISGAILIFLAVSILAVFQQQLEASLDDNLALRLEANRQLVDTTTSPASLQVMPGPNRELLTGEAVLRLYANDGTLLQDASPASGLTEQEHSVVLAAIASGTTEFRSIDLAHDEDFRVVAGPIDDGRGGTLILVTGLDLSLVDSPLRLLRIILAVAIPLAVVGSALGGYWVALRALDPVSAMADTADRITQGDHSQRVPGGDSTDELGHLARTLNSMIARLGETVERERHFTADAAHELRTPLAAIEAGIDVTLASERDPAEYQRVLTIIRGQTQRLARLSNQLMLLARLDSGALQETFTALDLGELIEALAESVSEIHAGASISVTQPPEPLIMQGDLELFARAIMNLLENAVIHAGETATIQIALERSGANALITIADNGPGIPQALADDVFLRFRRGDSSRSTRGSGLGLSIVQAIVELHGGTIALLPTGAKGGTSFRITFPLA